MVNVAQVVASTALAQLVVELPSDLQMCLAATDGVWKVFERLEGISEVAESFSLSLPIPDFLCRFQVLPVASQSSG